MQYILSIISLFTLLLSCDKPMEIPVDLEPDPRTESFSILTLGDSYTYGESVCPTCHFPYQLVDSLKSELDCEGTYLSIAKTGWTTTNLINNIATQQPADTFDLVTLLIGVNNQYQNKLFEVYETEFVTLLQQAIGFAQGDKNRVLIISIPDYAFTPFGANSGQSDKISMELDKYNDFAKTYADQQGISYVNITDITREGLNNPQLVANDGLHPSELAYSRFVEKLVPLAKDILK